MKPAVPRPGRRPGSRRAALLVSGPACISYGAYIAVQPGYGVTRGIAPLTGLFPMAVWGCGWIACGLVCLAYVAAPHGCEMPGMVAAMAPPMLWAVAYAMGGLLGTSPTAWGAVAPWASHTALILIITAGTRPREIVPVVTRE